MRLLRRFTPRNDVNIFLRLLCSAHNDGKCKLGILAQQLTFLNSVHSSFLLALRKEEKNQEEKKSLNVITFYIKKP